jgi:F5/8 type C domain/Carbohydrate binding module (family 6)
LKLPHLLTIDLGKSHRIRGFTYLPRQDGNPNGNIERYRFETSSDGTNWTTDVTSGRFANIRNNPSLQQVPFAPITARFFRLTAVREVNGNGWTSAAEINVLPAGGGFHRSVCVAEMEFNPDGTVKKVLPTKEGPAAVGHLNPSVRTEVETIAWESGVEMAKNDDVGVWVTDISNGDSIKVCRVDFGGQGAANLVASVAAAADNSIITLRLDSEVRTAIGTLRGKSTSALGKWEAQSCNIRAQGRPRRPRAVSNILRQRRTSDEC